MAYANLDALVADLKRNVYTPKTEEELRATATNRYKSAYDQQRLTARQGYENTNLALGQQEASLDKAYSKQLEQNALNTQQAYSQAGRTMLQRGMQRSSYGQQIQSNVALAGNKAQNEILENKNMAIGNIGEQRTLLARQLADQLNQYTAGEQSDILAYIDELEGREYDRKTSSDQYGNSLAMQIFEFQKQDEAAKQAQSNWQAEFNLAQSRAASGGSTGTGYTPPKTPPPITPPANNLLSILNSNVTKPKVSLPVKTKPLTKNKVIDKNTKVTQTS